jgi:hypothetical protein
VKQAGSVVSAILFHSLGSFIQNAGCAGSDAQ